MSVSIEGNISQASAASGWYQNNRVASPQEKEKDAPQPKADNAVKVSISQEGIEGLGIVFGNVKFNAGGIGGKHGGERINNSNFALA